MKKDKALFSSPVVMEAIVVAMLVNQVNDLRHAGLSDRAIARKLKLPRWIIRGVR